MEKPYDKNKIGKFIGWGGEHLVFAYGDDRVIKFSLHVWLAGRKAVEKKKRDYEIGNRYFGDYLLPTEILIWNNGKRAVEIQEKIPCRPLSKNDLDDSLINKQFNDIVEHCRLMEKEIGAPFDLLGREGLFKFGRAGQISNILITSDKKLILVDFTLLELKPKMREIPLWLVIQWAKKKQNKLLKNFILINKKEKNEYSTGL